MMNSLLFRRVPNGAGRFMVHAIKKLQLIVFSAVLLMICSTQANAQANSDGVLRPWANLEEADFLFDVFYQVVKCSPLAETQVHLWAFNEGGNVNAVGFTLTLKDEDGTEFTHTVEKFEIGLGQSYKPECGNEDYPYLKFNLPGDIDIETMSIDITYNK